MTTRRAFLAGGASAVAAVAMPAAPIVAAADVWRDCIVILSPRGSDRPAIIEWSVSIWAAKFVSPGDALRAPDGRRLALCVRARDRVVT